MNISIPIFYSSIRNILISLACYYFCQMPCWEILGSCRVARKFLSYVTMPCLAQLVANKGGKVYTCYDENISKSLDLCFLNKTTKSMNFLGGMGLECWFLVEWLHKDHGYGLPCASHLWYAAQEQRDFRGQVLRSLQCSHLAIWALP